MSQDFAALPGTECSIPFLPFASYSSMRASHPPRMSSEIRCWFWSVTSSPVFTKTKMKAGSRPAALMALVHHGLGPSETQNLEAGNLLHLVQAANTRHLHGNIVEEVNSE